MLNSFSNTTAFSLPGCRSLFLAEAASVTGYYFRNNQVDAITPNGAQFHAWTDLEALAYTIKQEQTKAGTVYIVDISFQIPALRADVSTLLAQLTNTDTTAIIEDENGRFWLLGFRQGFTASYEAGSDEGGYSVKMATRQISRVEEVSRRLMSELGLV